MFVMRSKNIFVFTVIVLLFTLSSCTAPRLRNPRIEISYNGPEKGINESAFLIYDRGDYLKYQGLPGKSTSPVKIDSMQSNLFFRLEPFTESSWLKKYGELKVIKYSWPISILAGKREIYFNDRTKETQIKMMREGNKFKGTHYQKVMLDAKPGHIYQVKFVMDESSIVNSNVNPYFRGANGTFKINDITDEVMQEYSKFTEENKK